MIPDIRWIFADMLIRATIVLLAGAIIATAARKAPAAYRHLVWLLACCAVLLMPILGATLPAWKVLPAGQKSQAAAQVQSVIHVEQPAEERPAPRIEKIEPRPAAKTKRANIATIQDAAKAVEAMKPAVVASAKIASQPPPHKLISTISWLFIAWAIGSAVLLGRLLVSSIILWRLKRRSAAIVAGSLAGMFGECAAEMNVQRHVALCAGDGHATPMTWGFVRPVILLPTIAESWPTDRVRLAMLHELAHVKRLDALAQWVGQIASAVYWFHPLVWIAARGLQREQELAADDRVLAIDSRGPDYAAFLVDLARNIGRGVTGDCFAIAMARPSAMESRVRAVLDSSRRKNALSFRAAAIAIIVAFAMIAPVAALRGQQSTAGDKSPATHPADSPVVFSGHVLSPDGKPVGGAELLLLGYDYRKFGYQFPASATSAGDGLFTLNGPATLDPDFAPQILAWQAGFGPATLNVRSGSNREIHLSAAASPKLIFIGPDGMPVKGLKVRPIHSSWGAFPVTGDMRWLSYPDAWSARLAGTTDANGQCVLNDWPANSRTRFEIDDERFARISGHDQLLIGPAEAKTPVIIHLKPAGTISGTITYETTNKPAVGIPVIAIDRGGYGGLGGNGEFVTNERGEYRITRVPEGNFVVQVLTHDREDTGWTAAFLNNIPVAAGANVAGKDIVLVKGTVVSGRVFEADTQKPFADARISSLDMDTQEYPGGTKTDADGRYAVRVPPGRIGIYLAQSPPNGYLAEGFNARGGEHRIINTVNGIDQTLDLKLTRKPGKPVAGKVVDANGKPLAKASVIATEVPTVTFENQTYTYTDADGNFRFEALMPDAEIDVRAGNAGTLSSVKVAGGEENLVIRIAPNAVTTVTGVVVDRDGKPVPNAGISIMVMWENRGGLGGGDPSTFTDALGRFTIPNLRAGGLYSIRITGTGYHTNEVGVVYTPGEARRDIGKIVMEQEPAK